MARTRLDDLGSLQRRVMEILWERGEGTVADVRQALTTRTRTPAYTTVLSVLQKLSQTGWVRHRTEGRTYVYRPARSRQQARASSVKQLVERVFRGDPVEAFQTLLANQSLDEHQVRELRELIDAHRAQEGRDGARKGVQA